MKIFQPTYTTATGETKRSPTFWVVFRLKGTRYRISTGYTSRRSAEQEARKIYEAKQNESAGIATYETTKAKPLAVLLEDFVGELRRRDRCKEHVDLVAAHLRAVFKGISRIEQCTPEAIRGALGRIAATPSGCVSSRGRPIKPRTQNRYRTAAHSFFAWLVKERRWPMNPVAAVPRVQERDPDLPRRALTPEELQKLLEAAVAPGTRMGPERRLVYLTAALTGLRRKELESVRVEDLDIEAASVRLKSSATKNRRTDVLPLAPSLVEELREHVKGKNPSDAVFKRVPRIETLRSDLVRAGILELDDEGRPEWNGAKLDFHALRVTFGTSLARADVPLVQAQRLMRHSDPKLTANVYTKLQLHDARGAIDKLDALHGAARTAAKDAGRVQDTAKVPDNGADRATG